ncbi:MAG: YDG domain-containing protein, partial [Candidatus Omnitrophota bacterium]|nr:YDG domain-containing protein [Candidatus Omnitrophota bacterium]
TGYGNYTVTQQTGLTIEVTAKAITVSGITAENKIEDGGIAATLVYTNAALQGKISGDDVTLMQTGTGVFGDASVGNNKTVAITGLAISGSDANNYNFNTTAATVANIISSGTTTTSSGLPSTSVYNTMFSNSTINQTAPVTATGSSYMTMMPVAAGPMVAMVPVITPAAGAAAQMSGSSATASVAPGQRLITIPPETFLNAMPSAQLPQITQFTQVSAQGAIMPIVSPTTFANIMPSAQMALPARFDNIRTVPVMPRIAAPDAFGAIASSVQLPMRADFRQVRAIAAMRSIVPPTAFGGVVGKAMFEQ